MDNLLNLKFPHIWGWENVTENKEPFTLMRDEYDTPVLQISTSKYTKGEVPNPDYKDLIKLSKNLGMEDGGLDFISENYGDGKFGKYGSAIFKSGDYPFFSFTHISNGKDFILITFICVVEASEQNLSDLKHMIENIREKKFGIF